MTVTLQRRCCRCGKVGQAGFLSGERGSFTLEAAFVAPLLVLATLTLIALALYAAQVADLHRTASAAAERSAFDWNQPDAGGGANQGLYWRIGEGMAAWFGLLGGGGDRHVELPVSGGGSSSGGVTAKLMQAAAKLPPVIRGSISLADRVLFRRLDVRLERPFRLQTMSPLGGLPSHETAGAQSTVVDPVELIRLVDLTRSYTPAVRARLTPAQARSALIEPEREDGGAVRIRSEREASEYLRKVTGGQQRTYPMEQGKSRVVDALDSGGIAHQAFYTYTEPQLLQDQMPKDAKLLQDGSVQGVVWHFFLSERAAEPSAALRAQLERRGIAVVVHR
jgi:hypothetical protein